MQRWRTLRRSVAVLAYLCVLLLPQVRSVSASGGPHRALAGDAGSGPAMPSVQAPAATSGIVWFDVPRQHWARTAIDYVGATNDWMRDFRAVSDGRYPFKPDQLETRERFARSIVRAFAPTEEPDLALVFPDLPADDRFYPFANVATELGWIDLDPKGNFHPDDPVTTRVVHQGLVLALGLGEVVAALQHLRMADGTPVDVPKGFGTLLLGMRLGLRYNHSDESLDVGPDTPLPRSEVAWSLYRASTEPSWTIDGLASYATMELPILSDPARQVVEFGLRYIGFPYVWGGEWAEPTEPGYCCGSQPVGGFDCSGFSWWALREASSSWDPVPPRTYPGWSLPERTSSGMAASGRAIGFRRLQPGDLMFYDGDANGAVDHVDVYIGNGWSMDSGGSAGGVSIVYVADGWYRDHFVHGRRVLAS
jgi:hypothetical protein